LYLGNISINNGHNITLAKTLGVQKILDVLTDYIVTVLTTMFRLAVSFDNVVHFQILT